MAGTVCPRQFLSKPRAWGLWRGQLIVKNPGKREVGRGMGGDPVLPLAWSRAGFDAGLCKGLLMAFSPAGLESTGEESLLFPQPHIWSWEWWLLLGRSLESSSTGFWGSIWETGLGLVSGISRTLYTTLPFWRRRREIEVWKGCRFVRFFWNRVLSTQ